MPHAFVAALKAVLPAGVSLSEAQGRALFEHWRLVQAWNQRVNLTAITSDSDAARLHYADSLHALPHLLAGSVLDVGSGAGFPGVPIAVADPGRRVVLMEPRAKRASFLQTAQARLGLEGLEVWNMRADEPVRERFANVVTRATFSDAAELARLLAWVAPGGQVVAFRAGEAALPDCQAVTYALGHEARSFSLLKAAK